MLPAELIKKIRRIEIRTSHMVNDVFAGQYHSAFKGRGMEFEEVRQYQIGDDVRSIDWNVSARYGQPFVKVFREERELSVILMVDFSGSLAFGSRDQLKRDLVAEMGATLAFSAIRNNDKVGLIGFTDRVEKVVPAQKGTRHVLRVIRELLYFKPIGRGTNLAGAFEHLNRVTKRKAVVFIISDFLDHDYEKPMQIARRRHDVIPIVVTDPRERELPDVGLLTLQDAETGRDVLVDTSSRSQRNRYAQRQQSRIDQRQRMFARMRIDSIEIATGQSFIEPITRYFRRRRARY